MKTWNKTGELLLFSTLMTVIDGSAARKEDFDGGLPMCPISKTNQSGSSQNCEGGPSLIARKMICG